MTVLPKLRYTYAKAGRFCINADGSHNSEYCRYCFENVKFTKPDIIMEQMIEKCVGIMREMQMPEVQINQTKTFIPVLKR